MDRTDPITSLLLSLPNRRTHDCKRRRPSFLFAVLNVATGELMGRYYRRHHSTEFLKFTRVIAPSVPFCRIMLNSGLPPLQTIRSGVNASQYQQIR